MTNNWNMHTVRSLQQEKNKLLGRISGIQKATQEGCRHPELDRIEEEL